MYYDVCMYVCMYLFTTINKKSLKFTIVFNGIPQVKKQNSGKSMHRKISRS